MAAKKTKKMVKRGSTPHFAYYSPNMVRTSKGNIRRTAASDLGSISGSAGKGSIQAAAQSPLYYDYRWSSPDKFYFPRNRVVANSIWREVYKRDPAIAVATDMYAELPWSSFELMGIDDKAVRQLYEDMFTKLNIVPKLPSFTRDFYVTGELILHNIFNSTQGIWDRVIPHNPDYVRVEGIGLITEQPLLWLLPTPEIKRLVNSTDPRVRKLQKLLPREIINSFRQNKEVPLDPLNTTYIPRLNCSTDLRGTSLYTRLFRVIMYEDFIVNASLAVAQRNAAPLRIFKLGDPNTGWLPDEDDEAAFIEMLSMAEADPMAAIVMHHNVSAELVGVSDKVLLISREWDFIERVKLLAMGVSKSFLSGESSFACFEEGTPVLLSDGTPVPIETIKNGDMVLDKNGNHSKVINNWNEGVPDELLEIEVWGGRKFRVTPNHRFPTWSWPTKCYCGCGENVDHAGRLFKKDHYNYKDIDYKSCEAKVHEGRHPISRIPVGYDPNKIVEAQDLKIGDFLKIPKKKSNLVINSIDSDKARLLGYYLAEGDFAKGSSVNTKNKLYSCRLTFGIHEINTWGKDVEGICKRLGIKCKITRPNQHGKPRNSITVTIIPENKDLLYWIQKHAGELSLCKKLSEEVLNWPDELLRELLIGYFRGDGTRRCKPSPAQMQSRRTKTLATVQCGTVSNTLATQLILVLSKLGYPVGHAVAKVKLPKHPYHILRIQGNAAIDFCKMVWEEDLNANAHRCVVWQDDEFMYVPVRSIKTVPNTKKVYNLEVAGDHTYLICDGIATCNSSVAGLQSLLERLSVLRLHFENDWIIKKIMQPIAEIHDFYKKKPSEIEHRIRVKRPLEERELIIPKIKWKKTLDPSQDVAILNIWRDLRERGILSERTYASGAGVDIDTERKNLKEERLFKQNNPDIYGIPAQAPQVPGAPGAQKPGAPKAPTGTPLAPMPASLHKRANPYREHNEVVDELHSRLEDVAQKVAGYKNSKMMVPLDDALEICEDVMMNRPVDDNKGSLLESASLEFDIPVADTTMLVGEKGEK